jgi:polyisoprenoid-binding protein YceI
MQTTSTTRTYAIDPAHSEVLFAVRHLMIAKVRGHFTGVTGTVTLGAGDVPTAIEASIGATTVSTRDEKRDAHLRSPDFLDVANFPHLTFKSTAITGSGPEFTIVGDLTIRGTTQSVTLQASVGGRATDPWGNDRVAYSASARIIRSAFGVSFNAPLETGGVMVSDEVDITLDIEAVAVPASA